MMSTATHLSPDQLQEELLRLRREWRKASVLYSTGVRHLTAPWPFSTARRAPEEAHSALHRLAESLAVQHETALDAIEDLEAEVIAAVSEVRS